MISDGYDTPECLEYRSFFKQTALVLSVSSMLLVMASSTIIYFTILLLLETNFVRKVWEMFLNKVSNLSRKSKPALVEEDDDDVKVEKRRIAEVFQTENRLRHRYQYNLDQGKH